MKVFSSGRSEIIEQAGRKSFHMWFDLDIPTFGISMEADLSLPTRSNRKISMMTSFNEELYNASAEFLKKVPLYDSDMREFTDDTLVTLVTKMLHNTIQRLNEKWEPLWNIFIKTPKAKAKELEQMKEEYLWKNIQEGVESSIDIWEPPQEIMSAALWETNENINIQWRDVKVIDVIKEIKTKWKTRIKKQKVIPSTKINEKPFNPNKVF